MSVRRRCRLACSPRAGGGVGGAAQAAGASAGTAPPAPSDRRQAAPARIQAARTRPRRSAPPAAAERRASRPCPSRSPTTPTPSAATPARNNAPFWRGVRESGGAGGYTSLPGAEKGVLIQPFVQYPGTRFTTAGEAWRQVRNWWIIPYGGALVLIVVLALALFYWPRGRSAEHGRGPAAQIERFTYFERAAHWTNAIAFVVLAISGLVMAFGKFLLLPVIGGTLFGWLTYALKTLHNFAGPLFAVSLVVVIVTFVRDNFPRRGDWPWLQARGGMLAASSRLRTASTPARRSSSGAACWCSASSSSRGWCSTSSCPGSTTCAATCRSRTWSTRSRSMLMIAMFIGHIYMGTIGMSGAYQAMRTGYVDEGWAEEHHQLWYEDIAAGKIPAQRQRPLPGRAARRQPDLRGEPR